MGDVSISSGLISDGRAKDAMISFWLLAESIENIWVVSVIDILEVLIKKAIQASILFITLPPLLIIVGDKVYPKLDFRIKIFY